MDVEKKNRGFKLICKSFPFHFLFLGSKQGIGISMRRIPFMSLDSFVFYVLLTDVCSLKAGVSCLTH